MHSLIFSNNNNNKTNHWESKTFGEEQQKLEVVSPNKWGLLDLRKSKIGKDFIEVWRNNVLLFIDFTSAHINCYEIQGEYTPEMMNSLLHGSKAGPVLSSVSTAPIKSIFKLPFKAISKCNLVVDKVHFDLEEKIYYFDLALAKSRNLPLYRHHRFRIHTGIYNEFISSLPFNKSRKSRKDYELEAATWVDALQSIAQSEKHYTDTRVARLSSASSASIPFFPSSTSQHSFASSNGNSNIYGTDGDDNNTSDDDNEPLPPPKPPKPIALIGKSSLDNLRMNSSSSSPLRPPPPVPARPSLRRLPPTPSSLIPPSIPPRPTARIQSNQMQLSYPPPPIPPRPRSSAIQRVRSIGESGRNLFNQTMDGNANNHGNNMVIASNPPPLPPRPSVRFNVSR